MSLESVWVPRAKEPKIPTHLMSEKSGSENTGAAAARSELRVGETLVFESSMCRRADEKRALSGRILACGVMKENLKKGKFGSVGGNGK
jgi:hypothetical protein